MWSRSWSSVTLGVISLLAPAPPQLDLSGYYTSPRAVEIDLPTEQRLPGPHAVEVLRSGPEEMLRRAESFLPPVDTVLAALHASEFGDPTLVPDDDLWWVGTYDGIRIPYAVNALAIVYYLEVAQHLRADSNSLGPDGEASTSTLTYHAIVSERDQYFYGNHVFRDVFVAKLELSYSTGPAVGMSFELQRIVVLDRDGDPIAVFGDSVPDVWRYG